MGVINMAHGEFMTIGAYTTYLLSRTARALRAVVPASATSCWRSWSPSSLAAGIGLLRRALDVRHLYKRPLDTLLATWGLSLIMQQTFRSMFGAKEVSATLPEWLMGSFKPDAQASTSRSTACSSWR